MIKPMVVSFCSVGGWCYCRWWSCDLKTLAQFQRCKMSLGLFQDFMDGYLNFNTLPIISWTVGSQSCYSQSVVFQSLIITAGSQFGESPSLNAIGS